MDHFDRHSSCRIRGETAANSFFTTKTTKVSHVALVTLRQHRNILCRQTSSQRPEINILCCSCDERQPMPQGNARLVNDFCMTLSCSPRHECSSDCQSGDYRTLAASLSVALAITLILSPARMSDRKPGTSFGKGESSRPVSYTHLTLPTKRIV